MQQQIFSILKLRFLQAKRLVDSVGILLILFALLITFGIAMQVFVRLLELPALYALPAVLFILTAIDFARKDKPFLQSIFDKKWQISSLVFWEYFLLSLPIYLFQIFQGQHFICLGILGVCLLVAILSPLFQFKKATGYKTSLKFFPLSVFELKFYFERNKWALLLVFGFGILTYWHVAFYGLSILFICMILPEVFRWLEPPEMLHPTPGFIEKKFIINACFTAPFVFVFGVLAWICHPEMMYLILYILCCFFIVLWLSINYKYANYNPFYPEMQTSHIMAMMTLLVVVPGGILISFSYAVFQYFKAKKNLARW